MIKRGVLAGLINLILGVILNFGFENLVPGLAAEYQNGLFRPWTDPLMMIFFAYPFITGIVLSYLWILVEKNFRGPAVSRAFQFAKLYFVTATIPGMFISYTTFKVSLIMILAWTLTGFIEAFVAGFVFTKIK